MILTQKCFPESTAGEQEPRKQISLSTSSLSLSPHCCELRKGATIPAPEQERGSTGSVWKGNFLGRTRQCQNSPLAPSPGHKPALRAQSPKLECRIKLRFLPLLWDSFPLVSPFLNWAPPHLLGLPISAISKLHWALPPPRDLCTSPNP